MGLIVNKPVEDITFPELLEQLGIEGDPDQQIRVLFGGPVETGRGFVLHSTDYNATGSTLQVSDEVGLTATLEILEQIAKGEGPQKSLLALGYAGWAPGQLEDEIKSNGWLHCSPSAELLFGAADDSKWERALAEMGIDPAQLSGEAGRA
jgi:putative transcriptional regulator